MLELEPGRNEVSHGGNALGEGRNFLVFELYLVNEGGEVVYFLDLFSEPVGRARRLWRQCLGGPPACAVGRRGGTFRFPPATFRNIGPTQTKCTFSLGTTKFGSDVAAIAPLLK